MRDLVEELDSLLSERTVALIYAPETPPECLEVLLDPLGTMKSVWDSCISMLKQKVEREEDLLRRLVKKHKISGVIFLSPSLASIKEDGVEEVRLLGRIEMVFCDKCRKVYSAETANENCPSCSGPLIPMIEPIYGDFSKRLSRALRISMSSDILLVLGEADQLLPGALIPWVAKEFGNVPIVVVSEKETSLSRYADATMKIDPFELLSYL